MNGGAGRGEMRVGRLAAVPAAELAAISCSSLDRPLTHAAELVVAIPSDEAVVLGAFQRASELEGVIDAGVGMVRRASGGAEARVGPGSVWIQLALARPDALVDCPPNRLLNRYVRPLLAALTKVGAHAHYFDRDWISALKLPVASVSFAHDSASARSVVEAIVAVRTPFAVRDRPSFLGKRPTSLEALRVEANTAQVADAVIDAYSSAFGIAELSLDTASEMTRALRVGSREAAGAGPMSARSRAMIDPRAEPPWAAVREEAIGIVAAGRDADGVLRVGGELMVSRDAMARLERSVAAAGGDVAAIEHATDELAEERVALVGVRSLASIRDVILAALETT